MLPTECPSGQVPVYGGVMFDTIEAIVDDILKYLQPPKRAQLRKMSSDQVMRLNCTFGREIRHFYDLWGQNKITLEWRENPSSRIVTPDGLDISPHHPYMVTHRIMMEVWKRVKSDKE